MKSGVLKVNSLEISNYKNLRRVELRPMGNHMVLAGTNGAGKTAITEAWQMCLNVRFSNGKLVPDGNLFREGAESPIFRLSLGDGKFTQFTITRELRPDGTLSILVNPYDEAGKKLKAIPKPAEWLERIVGDIVLDVGTLRNSPDADLLEMVYRKTPGLHKEMDRIDAEITGFKQQRSDINIEVRHLTSDYDRKPEYPSLPAEEVESRDLLEELRMAQEHNRGKEVLSQATENAQAAVLRIMDGVAYTNKQIEHKRAEVEQLLKEIADLEKGVVTLESQKTAAESATAEARTKAEAFQEIPVDLINERLSKLTDTNRQIAANRERRQLLAQIEAKKTEWSELGTKAKAKEQERIDVVAAAQLPIPGLQIGDGCLMYPHPETLEVLPIKSLSDGEFWTIACQLHAVALGELRVMMVSHWNDLDAKNEAALLEAAEAQKIQIIAHEVIREEKDFRFGFLVRDGEVVAQKRLDTASAE